VWGGFFGVLAALRVDLTSRMPCIGAARARTWLRTYRDTSSNAAGKEGLQWLERIEEA